jgi:predicted RNase H-like HicB family nuclease
MEYVWYWVIIDRHASGRFVARAPDVPNVTVLSATEKGALAAITGILALCIRGRTENGESPPRSLQSCDVRNGVTPKEVSRRLIAFDIPRIRTRRGTMFGLES